MKKKKVLIDLYSLEYPTCGFGQIALNYTKIFSEIQRNGNEDFDICFLLPKSMKGKKTVEGVQCYYAHSEPRYPWQKLKFRFPKVDVWHSVNQFCSQFPVYSHTKQIFTIHDYNFLFEHDSETIKDYLRIMQERIDRSTAVTFISHFTEQQVRENSNLDGKITRTIYNGIENLVGAPMVKPDFIKGDKPFFFAIGQFLPKKKFDVLLDMMRHFPDKELYICGQNEFKFGQEILRRIESEQLTNVHAPGMISNEERVWLFANCEAYMFPSIGEGFGLPAIEAMQFGKPVFASTYQSLPEIVGGHGYLWENFEPEYMAKTVKEGLTEFYSSDEKAEEVKKYASGFTYKKHVDEYLNLYRELLKD